MDQELRELRSDERRRRSLCFLGALALLLSLMVAVVLEQAYPPKPEPGGAAGEIRAVPPALLESQLRSGRLSNREADHWRSEPREKSP